jgi:hypothetical protein
MRFGEGGENMEPDKDKSPETFPVVEVQEQQALVDGKFKIIPTHWEFENPPLGLDRTVNPHDFWVLVEPGTGHMVAQRITPELVAEQG